MSGDALQQLAALNRISRIALQDMAPAADAATYRRCPARRVRLGIHRLRRHRPRACGQFVCDAVHAAITSEVAVGYRRALGSGVVGHVAARGETVDIPETRGHPRSSIRSAAPVPSLCVPIIHDGRVLAVLNVESLRPNAFAGQRDLLETVAAQISGALHAADLLQRLEAANAQLREAYRAMEQQAQTAMA